MSSAITDDLVAPPLQGNELVQVETYLRSEGVLVRFWYPLEMLEKPQPGLRKSSITGGQTMDTSNVHIHRSVCPLWLTHGLVMPVFVTPLIRLCHSTSINLCHGLVMPIFLSYEQCVCIHETVPWPGYARLRNLTCQVIFLHIHKSVPWSGYAHNLTSQCVTPHARICAMAWLCPSL